MRPEKEIGLWEGAVPGAQGDDPLRDRPALQAFWPEQPNGAAVIIAPGGGYWELMDAFEGKDYALWFNERGITAFVLRYRLASAGYHHPEITEDMKRALRLVRASAEGWGLDAGKIGVIGSSAGGHLCSYVLTHFDEGKEARDEVEKWSCRPDFGILCYALISARLSNLKNLLGENPAPELRDHVSSEQQVRGDTPPCFLWHTLEDQTVSVEHTLLFARALQEKGVPYSLHVYPKGAHSIGIGVWDYKPGSGQKLHPWTFELERWLGELGILEGGDFLG